MFSPVDRDDLSKGHNINLGGGYVQQVGAIADATGSKTQLAASKAYVDAAVASVSDRFDDGLDENNEVKKGIETRVGELEADLKSLDESVGGISTSVTWANIQEKPSYVDKFRYTSGADIDVLANLDFQGANQIIGLQNPGDPAHAATKGYVDAEVATVRNELTGENGSLEDYKAQAVAEASTLVDGLRTELEKPDWTSIQNVPSEVTQPFWDKIQDVPANVLAPEWTTVQGKPAFISGIRSELGTTVETGDTVVFQSHVDMQDFPIINVAAPSAAKDAARKDYVDGLVSNCAQQTYVDTELNKKYDILQANKAIDTKIEDERAKIDLVLANKIESVAWSDVNEKPGYDGALSHDSLTNTLSLNGNLDMAQGKIVNLAPPEAGTDAVSLSYLQSYNNPDQLTYDQASDEIHAAKLLRMGGNHIAGLPSDVTSYLSNMAVSKAYVESRLTENGALPQFLVDGHIAEVADELQMDVPLDMLGGSIKGLGDAVALDEAASLKRVRDEITAYANEQAVVKAAIETGTGDSQVYTNLTKADGVPKTYGADIKIVTGEKTKTDIAIASMDATLVAYKVKDVSGATTLTPVYQTQIPLANTSGAGDTFYTFSAQIPIMDLTGAYAEAEADVGIEWMLQTDVAGTTQTDGYSVQYKVPTTKVPVGEAFGGSGIVLYGSTGGGETA